MPIKIKLICVGKIRETYLISAQMEYIKRLSRYARIEIAELADEPDTIPTAMILTREAERVSRSLPDSAEICALAVEGKQVTSERFAEYIGKAEDAGRSLVFIIGGSNGLDDSIKKGANTLLSLSEMTFPHRLARIVLLEQIYRAFKILRKENYHK